MNFFLSKQLLTSNSKLDVHARLATLAVGCFLFTTTFIGQQVHDQGFVVFDASYSG